MIKLNESLYIAKGAERKCYFSPLDKNKVIKVDYKHTIDRNQNVLDDYYYKYLQKKEVSFKHIPKYYGQVQTNMGIGTIFQSIQNYDGSISQTLETILTHKVIDYQKTIQYLEELQNYLKDNGIVFGDVVLSNVVYQKLDTHTAKLVIIDGLGARRLGWKLWLQMHCKSYNTLRIHKQWKKLMTYVEAFDN